MYRNEIGGFINFHREEIIEDICTLCRINSEKMPYVEDRPYGKGPFQILQAALGMAEGYDFSIRNYDNYMGTADLNDKERQLDILAYLDVVPADEGWTETKPFEPAVKNEKLFGRGATDDKGPAVAALYTTRAVKELGIPLSKNVRLVLGTDREYGSSDIVNCYGKEGEAPMTFSLGVEFPIISIGRGRLEGHFHTSFQASKAMPGLVRVEAGIKANAISGKTRAVVEGIDLKTLEAAVEAMEKETGIPFVLEGDLPVMTVTAQGEGTRTSAPQEGKNALTGLLVYPTHPPFAECPQMGTVKSLLKLFPHGDTCGKAAEISMEDKLFGVLALTFSMLTAGVDGLKGIFDSRCPICTTEESILGVVEQAMAGQGLVLGNDSMIPPRHVDENSHFVRTLLSVYEDYTGLEGSCQATGGGIYVHSLKNDVAYGTALPGTGNRMYGADEFAVVGGLVLGAKIFAQIIAELCS